MKLNVNEFHKVRQDNESTTLRHPDGHEIVLRHDKISPKFRGELKSMHQHLADEGQVDAAPEDQDNAAPLAAPTPMRAPAAQPTIQPTAPPKEVQAKQAADPFGTQKFLQTFESGMGQYEAGIGSQAAAEMQQGQQAQQALNSKINQDRAILADHQRNIEQYQNISNQVMNDVAMGHINPNQFWEDKSLPGKVSTAIGLIAGGIGGGLTGQGNAAAAFLNAQIDRNISAQRLNLENKYNLLNINRQQFGDESEALGMTRVMTNDLVSNQLQLAAANTSDLAARARLLQASGQFRMQNAPILSQLAARKTLLGGAAQGGPQIDPATMIRFNPLLPENEKEAAMKELSEAEMMNKFRDNVLSSFDQSRNLINKGVTSPQLGEQLDAIINPNLASLSKDTAGRFTDTDSQYLRSLFPNRMDKLKPGNTDATWDLKRRKLEQLVNQKMNFPRLKSVGIDPTTAGRYLPGGASKFQLAPPKAGQ